MKVTALASLTYSNSCHVLILNKKMLKDILFGFVENRKGCVVSTIIFEFYYCVVIICRLACKPPAAARIPSRGLLIADWPKYGFDQDCSGHVALADTIHYYLNT